MSVDLDRQLREFCRLIDETQGSVSFDDILERSGELQVVPGRKNQELSPRRKSIPAVITAIAILVVVLGIRLLPSGNAGPADQPPTTTITDPTTAVSNGWIAFSTQPGGAQISETDWDRGGDIYLVRPDVEPRLIVERGEAKITNVCPTFSSDGSMLAYGERTDSNTALVVLDIDPGGSVSESTRIDLGPGGSAPCPRWSHDGSRLAYLAEEPPGPATVVVRGLDGSTPDAGDGDPTVSELRATMPTSNPLEGVTSAPSPDGSSVARLEEGDVISIANSDGSQRREISSDCGGYGLAAWSPDGRYILVISDSTGRDAVIHACSVDQPFEPRITVDSFRVNGGRSWPGFGDVSWQPIPSNS